MENYWEKEQPVVVDVHTNKFVYFEGAGKLQTYKILHFAANGVSKSVTYEFDKMCNEDFAKLKKVILEVLTKESIK